MPINTLVNNGDLLRKEVVPVVETLEAAVENLEGNEVPLAARKLLTLYLPDLIGANADSQQMRLPGFTGWRIVSVRATAFKGGRDGDVSIALALGSTPVEGSPLVIIGTSAGGTANINPTTDNVYTGTAIVVTVGGANTVAGDGNLILVLEPPVT